MKRHIPNFLTSLNVLFGSIACIMAVKGNSEIAAFCILSAAVFDFLDGFSARLLKAYSPIGKELDSLADVISFGLAPSLLVFNYLSDIVRLYPTYTILQYAPYFALLIVVFSALRLAKFNIDERQTSSFIGLPTPANALFWLSYCLGLLGSSEYFQMVSLIPTLVLVLVFSLLLTAEIPMFSLKMKTYKWKNNELIFILIAFFALVVALWGIIGISMGIVFYILLSIVSKKIQKKII